MVYQHIKHYYRIRIPFSLRHIHLQQASHSDLCGDTQLRDVWLATVKGKCKYHLCAITNE